MTDALRAAGQFPSSPSWAPVHRVAYRLELDDRVDAALALTRRHKRRQSYRWYLLCVVVLVLILVVAWFTGDLRRTGHSLALACVAMALAIYAGCRTPSRRSVKRVLEAEAEMTEWAAIELSEAGITVASPSEVDRQSWGKLAGIERTPELILLRISETIAEVIPIRFFTTAEEAEQFCKYAAARIPHRGRCRECGYDLKGNLSGSCPECGWRIDPAPLQPPRSAMIARVAEAQNDSSWEAVHVAEYEARREDFIRTAIWKRCGRGRWLLYAIGSAIVFAVFMWIGWTMYQEGPSRAVLTWILTVITTALIVRSIPRWIWQDLEPAVGDYVGLIHEIRLSEAGVTIRSALHENAAGWSRFRSIHRAHHAFYLRRGGDVVDMVPLRAFGRRADAEAFFDFARAQLCSSAGAGESVMK